MGPAVNERLAGFRFYRRQGTRLRGVDWLKIVYNHT
jgi:hypothetical protein